MALTDFGLSEDVVDSWRGMLWAAGRANIIKSYQFRSLTGLQSCHYQRALAKRFADLHTFQTLVTGFDVLYEG